MRPATLALATLILIAPYTFTNVRAQQLPNDVDLKAAYCIGVLQQILPGLKSQQFPPETKDSLKNEVAKAVEQLDSNLNRLQLYLLPRIGYLDLTGIVAAGVQSQDDYTRSLREGGDCLTECYNKADANCTYECSRSGASTKMRMCVNISFLPY